MLRIFRHYLPASALLLFVCDATVIVSIFFVATRILASTQPMLPDIAQRHTTAIIFAGLFSTILFHVVGLYSKWLITDFARAMPRLVVCFVLAAPFIVVFWLVQLPNPGGVADTNQAMIYLSWTGFAFAGVSLWRAIFAALARATKTPYRVLVVGTGKLAAQIEDFISQDKHTNTTIVGYTSLCDEKVLVPERRLRPLKAPEGCLLSIAKQESVREIVVALDDRRGVPLRMLLDARMEGIRITSYLSFWERETRRVNLGSSASQSVIEAFRGLYANFLVQEFIAEAKGSDLRCFVVGNKVVAAMQRDASPGEFRANLHRGGTAVKATLSAQEKKIAIRAAQALGLGIAGVDLLRSDRGPLLLEVNASPGLEGIEAASGVDVSGCIIKHLEQNAAS